MRKLFFILILISPTILSGCIAKNPGKVIAVSTSNPIATEEAINILKQGGTAADAFITASTIISNLAPREAGLGGGFFAIYYDNERKEVSAIDAREEAPRNIDPRSFLDANGEPIRFFPERQSSTRAVGVPGVADGFSLLHKNFGKLNREVVLEPAIRIAEEGFEVNDYLAARLLEDAEKSCEHIGTPRMADVESTRDIYYKLLSSSKNPKLKCQSESFYPWQPLESGDTLTNPNYAKALRELSNNGFKSFYTGDIGKAILKVLSRGAKPSRMDLQDLKNYRAVMREAVVNDFRTKDNRMLEIVGMGPPSSGAIAMGQMLNLLDDSRTKDKELDITDMDKYKKVFVLSEISKIAFRDRNFIMADEDFINDIRSIKSIITNRDYANNLREKFMSYKSKDLETGSYIPKSPSPKLTEPPEFFANLQLHDKCLASIENKEQGTSHISISDKYGNVISATITTEAAFGSGIVVPGYGFLLNNELTDFEPTLGRCNSIEAGLRPRNSAVDKTSYGEEGFQTLGAKRPRSSMNPVIIFEEAEPIAAFGAAGGSTIIGTTTQIFVNLYEHGMNIDDAIQAPRVYNTNSNKVLLDEELYRNKGLVKFLELSKTASEVVSIKPYMTAAQGITLDLKHNKAKAAADQRRGGAAKVDYALNE